MVSPEPPGGSEDPPKSGANTIWIYALYVFSPVTDGKKFAFAAFGFRNKIDLAGPARIADHRDAKKTAAKRNRRAREFFPRLRTSTSAQEMPILAHVNAENSFLHTSSVTDGKNFDFCTRSRLRTEKNSRPPAATSKEEKLCIFPITDGTKNRFWHTLSVTEGKKSTRAFYFFGARHCRPALGRCPPQSDRDKSATEKEDARTTFFSRRAGVHFFFFSCRNTYRAYPQISNLSPDGRTTDISGFNP